MVCELIESKRPKPGVLPILDDVCKTMHARGGAEGLDGKFLETIGQHASSHAHYQSAGQKGFIIKHYAGDVEYSCQGFGDANRDALRPDLVVILQNAREKMLSHLFPEVRIRGAQPQRQPQPQSQSYAHL